ncbi:hypothetical protein WDW37_13320 [Bdellovibrionota bacterium FG-1]
MSQLKLRPLFIFLILLLPATAGIREAAADSRETLFRLQRQLEERISPIVKSFDRQAFVFVSLQAKQQDHALPMTPFVLKNVSVEDGRGDLAIARVDVRLVTRKQSVPQGVLRLIENLLADLGPRPTIKVDPLPEALYSDENAMDARTAYELKSANDAKLEMEKKAAALEAKLAVPKVDYYKVITDDLRALVTGPIGLGILTAVGLFVFLFLLIIWSAMRGKSTMLKALNDGFERLGAAMEQGGGGRNPEAGTFRETENTQVSQGAQSGEPGTTGSELYNSFTDEGLLALLTDCYWSECDEYGAYLWRRIPVPRKKALLDAAPFLQDYAGHLQNQAENNLKNDQDPYYIFPLPVWHLDNAVLTDVVRKNKSLFSKLSSLRIESMSFTALERIELARGGVDRLTQPPDFAGLKPSAIRSLRKQVRLNTISIEEERGLLGLAEVTTEIVQAAPSLGWLLLIDPKMAEAVLKTYSARDLATAWIGPPEILEKLMTVIPPKKAKLLISYASRIQPSRNSAVFRAIHEHVAKIVAGPDQYRLNEESGLIEMNREAIRDGTKAA